MTDSPDGEIAPPERSQGRLLEPKDQNIVRETDHIVGRAQERTAHFVSLPPLVLFSTESGDAWMLDPTDGTALCLARGGERQDFHVADEPTRFEVGWNADYRIEGDTFVVTERTGRIRSIAGYPISDILAAMARTMIPEASPLLDHVCDETPPEAEIERLAGAIRADPEAAMRCLALFDVELKFGWDAHGALLVWVGFALALAGDRKAFERFREIARAWVEEREDVLFGHYLTALGGLHLYEESARRVVGGFPLADPARGGPSVIRANLDMLVPVCSSGDELLKKRVAAEVERLLQLPELPDECVAPACRALAAADPKRALDLVPMYLERCVDSGELKMILRTIRKRGSAADILVPPWPAMAQGAAEELRDEIDFGSDGDEDYGLDDDFEDEEEEEEDAARGEHWSYGRKPTPPPPEPDPYSPCPCGSGKKYKWCCRGKERKGRGVTSL